MAEKMVTGEVGKYAQQVFAPGWFKAGFAAGMSAIMGYVVKAPNLWQDLVWILFLFTVLDMITGTWVSIVVDGRRFSSAGVQRSIGKFLFYGVIFLVGATVDHVVHETAHIQGYAFSFLVLILCVLREATSINENLKKWWLKMYPGCPYPFDPVFAWLQSLLKVDELLKPPALPTPPVEQPTKPEGTP